MSEKTARHYSFFPLLWPAAAFAVGIVLQAEFDIGPWQSASVCLIAGAAALALSPRTAATVALLVCFTAAGALTLRTVPPLTRPGRGEAALRFGRYRVG